MLLWSNEEQGFLDAVNEQGWKELTADRLAHACMGARVACLAFLAVCLVGVAACVIAAVLAGGFGGNPETALPPILREYLPYDPGGRPLVATCVDKGTEAALLGVALFVFQRALGRIARTGRPFRREFARIISGAGYLIAACGVLPGLLGTAAALAYASLHPEFSVALEPEGGIIRVSFLMIAGMVVALAWIFEYGAILQRQDDELL